MITFSLEENPHAIYSHKNVHNENILQSNYQRFKRVMLQNI